MINDTTLAVIAVVAAVGLLGLVVIETINMPQQEQQAFARGCQNGSSAFFKSKGGCFHP